MIKEFREKRVQKEDYGKIVRAGKLVATALYSTDSQAKKNNLAEGWGTAK